MPPATAAMLKSTAVDCLDHRQHQQSSLAELLRQQQLAANTPQSSFQNHQLPSTSSLCTSHFAALPTHHFVDSSSPPSTAAAVVSFEVASAASTSPTQPMYACRKCGRSYRTKYTCRRHERNECGMPARFSCDECGFRAKHKHNLKQHYESVHMGRRPTAATRPATSESNSESAAGGGQSF